MAELKGDSLFTRAGLAFFGNCDLMRGPNSLEKEGGMSMTGAEILLFVGAELGKGAIAYVGGAIAEQQLHDLGIIRRRDIVKEIVAAVRAVVRQEIDAALSEQEIGQMEAKIANACSSLVLFSNASSSQRNNLRSLLTDSIIPETGYVIERAKAFDFAGAHIMAASFNLRLIALHGLYRISGDKGYHLTAAKEIADNSSTIQQVLVRFREQNRPETRITDVKCIYTETYRPRGRDPEFAVTKTHHICTFHANGREYKVDREDGEQSKAEATANHAAVLAELIDTHGRIDRDYSTPLENAIVAWKDIASVMSDG